jgi:hypothetical protein
MRTVYVANRKLHIFDDVLDFGFRESTYIFLRNSNFRIGWNDTHAIESASNQYLHSSYSSEDVDRLGIYGALEKAKILPMLEGWALDKAIVNLSNPGDCHFVHSHRDQKVLLYYANMQWKHEWAGETLFYADDLKEVNFASPYTPGRFILFDGEIPHTIRPQASQAPGYRFTFSMFFNRNL